MDDWSAEQSVEVLRDMLTREVRQREAAEHERDLWKDRATVNADKVIAQATRLAAQQPIVDAAEVWVDGLGERGPLDAKARWDGVIAAVRDYRQQAARAVGAGEVRDGE